ncbi:MAG: hypothetical protein EAS49_01330, partial [Brucella intermedia]
NLAHRDHIDSTREESPLRQADDAVVLDNSAMNHDTQLQFVLDLVAKKKPNLKESRSPKNELAVTVRGLP